MEFLTYADANEIGFNIVDVYNKRKYKTRNEKEFLLKIHNVQERFLAEIPTSQSPLVVDVDIKLDPSDEIVNDSKTKRLYDLTVVKEIVVSYCSVLSDICKDPLYEYKVLLLEKKSRSAPNKDGFHLHFLNVLLDKSDLKRVWQLVKETSEYAEYIDNVTSKPWLLYGSKKSPESEPYLITKGMIINDTITFVKPKSLLIGETIHDIIITEENVNKLLPLILSIRNIYSFSMLKHQEINAPQPETEENLYTSIVNNENKYRNYSKEKISSWVMMLSPKRAENYNDWVSIGMILTSFAKDNPKDADFYKSLFHSFSNYSTKYDENGCDEKWNLLIKSNFENGLGIGTLIYFVKQDNNIENIKDIFVDFSDNIPLDDFAIASHIKDFLQSEYMTLKIGKEKFCYKFDNTIWKLYKSWESEFKLSIPLWYNYYIDFLKRKGIISHNYNLSIAPRRKRKPTKKKNGDEAKKQTDDDGYDDDDESVDSNENSEEDDERLFFIKKSLYALNKKIQNYTSRTSIVNALFELYFDLNLTKLFDQNNQYIVFKNAIFDTKTWKFIQPSPNLYLSHRIENDYIDWSTAPQDKKDIVLKFWEQIFSDKSLRDYCMKTFARILTGNNYFKQFLVLTGVGHNGKTTFSKLMEKIFNGFFIKLPKSVILGCSSKPGSATPEICRIKNARIVVIDEITTNHVLDPGQIKGLSGNDNLPARDLFVSSEGMTDIKPYFFPVMITNENPIIKRPDAATWERIRLIEFDSIFTSNIDEYLEKYPNTDRKKIFQADPKINEILDEAEYFLSYFMNILLCFEDESDFNLEECIPNKVKEGLERFKSKQNIIKQFMDESFVINDQSTEIISYNKLLKEYNASKPTVTLSLEEFQDALLLHFKNQPSVVLTNGKIKGLSRITY